MMLDMTKVQFFSTSNDLDLNLTKSQACKTELMLSFCCKLHEAAQTFVMVDCKYDKYQMFEPLLSLFLFLFCFGFFSLVSLR